jgi:two-component system chemotaxis response regulator CheY
MKILIVDDNADIRSLMRAILESKGHTVVGEAEDGPGALKLFRESAPDIVLLDIIMPGMSGVEVLEAIRRIDPSARVVMVTAVEQDRVNRRLVLDGADGIIYKPFKQSDFDDSFNDVMLRKPPAAPAAEKGTIKRMVAGGLSRCMLKTSEATSWSWGLHGVEVLPGRAADLVRLASGFGAEAAAVQINVRDASPFSAALVCHSRNIAFISGCFAQEPLYRTGAIGDLEERMFMEVGNIILNALAGPLITALNTEAIPSVPILVKGGPASIAASLTACMERDGDFRVISAGLAMKREGSVARAGVLCALPNELAARLEPGT